MSTCATRAERMGLAPIAVTLASEAATELPDGRAPALVLVREAWAVRLAAAGHAHVLESGDAVAHVPETAGGPAAATVSAHVGLPGRGLATASAIAANVATPSG